MNVIKIVKNKLEKRKLDKQMREIKEEMWQILEEEKWLLKELESDTMPNAYRASYSERVRQLKIRWRYLDRQVLLPLKKEQALL